MKMPAAAGVGCYLQLSDLLPISVLNWASIIFCRFTNQRNLPILKPYESGILGRTSKELKSQSGEKIIER